MYTTSENLIQWVLDEITRLYFLLPNPDRTGSNEWAYEYIYVDGESV